MRVTNYILSYLIGLIFLVGGILFMVLLEDNRFLFGITYVLVGLLLVVGTHMTMRRRARAANEQQ